MATTESRLNNNFGKDNTQEANEDESTYAVKGKTKAVIHLAANSAGFENLRTSIVHKEVFATFINLCLVHFCLSMNWRYKAYNTVVSDIFTESSEAFAILLLENNSRDYKKLVEKKRKLTTKEAHPKYTKDVNENHKFRGWSRKGIRSTTT